jgi:hypothetical protein
MQVAEAVLEAVFLVLVDLVVVVKEHENQVLRQQLLELLTQVAVVAVVTP